MAFLHLGSKAQTFNIEERHQDVLGKGTLHQVIICIGCIYLHESLYLTTQGYY
jgi:hypothetical protein